MVIRVQKHHLLCWLAHIDAGSGSVSALSDRKVYTNLAATNIDAVAAFFGL